MTAVVPRRGLVLGSGGVLGFAWLLGALTALETDKNRRDGAYGFGGAVLRSPLVAWLLAAAVVVFEWIKRHGQ